jgi:hypothetical protein
MSVCLGRIAASPFTRTFDELAFKVANQADGGFTVFPLVAPENEP